MEKIFYGLKYYVFGFDSASAITYEAKYVLMNGKGVELYYLKKDQFEGDKGRGDRPHLSKTERNHSILKVDSEDNIFDGERKLGKIIFNQFGKKIKSIFVEAGVPQTIDIPSYGGYREVKIY
jgi:hypothetical protein